MSSLFYLLFVLYFWSIVTFVYILPWLCQDLGFSLYYKSSKHSKEKLEIINTQRTMNSFKFFSHLKGKTDQNIISLNESRYPEKNLKITFVVVSVKRRSNPHYLLQVVARLLNQTQGDTDTKKWKAKIVVLNADTNPSENKDAIFLEDYVTVVSRQTLYKGINWTVVENVYEKEKQDYTSALEIGDYLNADYTIIMEDDALPDRNFLQKLKFLVHWKISWFRTKPDWAFLKLYYPEKWQGYGNPEIPEIVLIFLVGGLIPTAIYVYLFLYVKGIRKYKYKYKYQMAMIMVLFISCGLYCTAVAYTVGRAHLIELGKISPLFYRVSQAPGCCTPCVLYQKLYLKQIVKFLRSKQCSKDYPLDFALDDFVSSQNLVKYLASPNLVSHIGFHTSLGGANKSLKEFSLLFDP